MRTKQKPLTLSIIIPVYNEEDYLEACLESIAQQTASPDEVIVVDNNSTDKSVEIATRFSFVKIIKESRQGRVFARNRGFKAGSSELICRIDADTHLPKGWVAEVLDYYSDPEHADHVITGGTDFYNLPLKALVYRIHKFLYFKVNMFFLGFQNLFGSNMVVPKNIARLITVDSCATNDYHEDIDFSIHLNEAGYTGVFLEELRVRAALRGIWTNREMDSPNRFVVWKETLRVHNMNQPAFETILGLIILTSIISSNIQLLVRRAHSRIAGII